jgi:hypothetical protein
VAVVGDGTQLKVDAARTQLPAEERAKLRCAPVSRAWPDGLAQISVHAEATHGRFYVTGI